MREILFALVFIMFGLATYAVNQSGHLAEAHIAKNSSVSEALAIKQSAEQSIEYKNPTTEKRNFVDRTFEDPVALFTMVLTTFTGLLFVATRSLWVATNELVVGADRTAERQLRAYVGKVRIDLSAIVDGSNVEATVAYKNFGQTPALNFDTRLRLIYRRLPFHENTEEFFDGEIRPDYSLMPNAESVTICSCPMEGWQDMSRQVREGEWTFILIGSVVYCDIYDKPHHVKVIMNATGPRAFARSPFTYLDGNTET